MSNTSNVESDCVVTTLSPEMLKRAKEEFGEDDYLRESSIIAIRLWLKEQPHLKSACTDSIFLLAFLRTCKFNLEETKRKLESFMTMKNALPEFYGQWDPMESNNQAVLSCGIFLPLPGYDPLGCQVHVYRPGLYDPCNMSFDHFMKVGGMIGRMLIKEEEQMYITGSIGIFDFKGYSFNHFTQLISKGTKLISINEGMYPSRPKYIICINTPAIFQKYYQWGSTLLKEKLKRRVIVCSGHGNYESLYKYVSKSFLPKDYGGDGISLEELTSYWKKKAEDNRDLLMHEERVNKADESKRVKHPKKSRKLFGIMGPFLT